MAEGSSEVERSDVVVLGTGAAGLTAAIAAHEQGASVTLLERGDQVGGTSAWSGGMLWVPCNHLMAADGIEDSEDEALRYLDALSQDTIDPVLARAYVRTAPEAVRFLEEHTPAAFEIVEGFPDYHPEHPGGKPGGGRSLQCPLYPFTELGDWASRVTRGRQLAAGASGVHVTIRETPLGHATPGGVPAQELDRRRRADLRGIGQSLVGRLLRGCLDRGIEPRAGHRAIELVTEDGRVGGVRVQLPDGTTTTFGARGGVILAVGGFEWDPDLRRSFLRGPLERPVSIPTNTGDGLRMAMRVGASLGNMREAWWTATIDVPDAEGETIAWMINGERTRPRTIMVNQRGERFANEAANYNAFGAAFHVLDAGSQRYVNLPSWMVFDHGYLERYSLAGWDGSRPAPAWITSADTLAGLAARLSIPSGALEATVERWNTSVERGVDVDFGRGESAHDQWWGDPLLTGSVAANLGPLDTPPYHAVEVHAGALGTKGGPRTTVEGQVVDVDGRPIEGLYAAGNTMASAMGMTYGGAGGTLGPAVAFGFAAGRHAGTRGATAGRSAARSPARSAGPA